MARGEIGPRSFAASRLWPPVRWPAHPGALRRRAGGMRTTERTPTARVTAPPSVVTAAVRRPEMPVTPTEDKPETVRNRAEGAPPLRGVASRGQAAGYLR